MNKDIKLKMSVLDENGKLVEIPNFIKEHINQIEKSWFEKMKKLDENYKKQIQELEHRLSNCIEPKFKQGDYLYSVEKSGSQILLAEGYVTTITQLDDGSIWYHLSVKPHEFGVRETTCYKTMDEVHEVSQKLLKEIDDEQNNRKS